MWCCCENSIFIVIDVMMYHLPCRELIFSLAMIAFDKLNITSAIHLFLKTTSMQGFQSGWKSWKMSLFQNLAGKAAEP